MAIVYFYGEDEKHYKKEGIDSIKKRYRVPNKIETCFKEEEVEKLILKSLEEGIDTYILTPLLFHSLIQKYYSFVKIERLKNQNGILTSQDIKLGITAEEKLKSKLNSSITKPKVTFDNYGGATDLIEETESINNYFKLGIPVKGIFLAGIPGTGKTFFAKCLAGQLNRFLIELNLTKFMKSENSIILIEEFFDFFKTNPGDYIIWLDEIEKMFTGTEESTQLLGTLLTKINEFNSTAANLKSTAFIVATANNVYSLSKRNPEFFRNGRFDILIALNPPTDVGAKQIFNIYISANIKNNETIFLNTIYLSLKKQIKISDNNSLLKKINDYVAEKQDAILSFINENSINSKKTFVLKIQEQRESSYFAKSLLDDLNQFKFEFDVEKTISLVFKEYRDKCSNVIRFPYVPAEIEYFVTSLYKHFLFKDIVITEEIIEENIKKIKPLQASMKDQITHMEGVTSDFRQI